MKIYNINRMPGECIEQFGADAQTRYLGKAAGSKKFYVNIDKIPSGSYSTKYHSHSKQEEFFLILNGSGVLRMGGEEYSVAKGDFISKLTGEQNAHHFFNSGNTDLEILDVGLNENGDIAYYPDEEVYLLRDEKIAFCKNSRLTNWSSDPSESI